MAEIKKNDVFEDAAIKAPLEFAKNVDVSVKSVDDLIASLSKLNGTIQGAQSTVKLSQATKELSDEQKELNKITGQVQTANAKLNDEYVNQKKALADANTALKEKILLGDRDAKSVTAQNSSQQILGAALAKNRREYANLKDEQARNSKEGKELLEIITKQDQSFKKLSDSVGEHGEHVGDYAGQLGFLNKELGESAEKVSKFGESLLEIATSTVGVVLAAVGLSVAAVAKSLESFFETTDEGEIKLTIFKGQLEGVEGALNKVLSRLGKKIVGEGSIADSIKSIVSYIPGLTSVVSLFEALGEKGAKVAEHQIELEEEAVSLTVERAQLENQATKDLLASQDKVNHSDEQRLELLRESNKLRDEALKSEQEQAKKELQILVDRIHLSTNDPTVAQKQKVADLEAKIIDLETQSLQQRRRAFREETTLILEIEKSNRDAALRTKISSIDLRKSELAAIIAQNKAIIASDDSTLEQREAALTQETSAEFELLRRNTQELKLNAENQAKERLIQRDNRLASDKEGLDKALKQDQAFQKELLKIDTDAQAQGEQNAVNYTNTLNAILSKGYQETVVEAKRANDKRLVDLDQQLSDGLVSVSSYETQRKLIEDENKKESLRAEIAFQKTLIKTKEAFGQDTIKAEKTLDDLEVQLTEENAKTTLEIEKEKNKAILEAKNQLTESAIKISENFTQSEINNLQAQSNALKRKYDEDISQAGDNQRLKQKLQDEYDKKQEQFDHKRVQVERRQAIFEKALNAASVIQETAAAEAKALPLLSNPVTASLGAAEIALIGAIGAAKLAVILTTPLPQYERGTESARGGLSIVGEKGTEMFVTPSGELGFTQNQASLMDVEPGTKIFTHDKTMSLLALAGLDNVLSERLDADDIAKKLDEVKHAIYATKQPQTNYIKNGLDLLEVTKERDNFTKIRRSIVMGKWVK